MVKKGDLLAVIDPRPYEAALAQAQAALTRDEAQLADSRLDLKTLRRPHQAGFRCRSSRSIPSARPWARTREPWLRTGPR